jgi:hypothetical protein
LSISFFAAICSYCLLNVFIGLSLYREKFPVLIAYGCN